MKKNKIITIILTLVIVLVFSLSTILTNAYSNLSISDALTEENFKNIILTSLQEHINYSDTLFHDYSSKIFGTGYFGSGDSGEDGIRTHNNYLLIYSFLLSENTGNLDKEQIKNKLIAGIKYSVNTHKTGSYSCQTNGKWGQTWQSSLWTSTLALAGYLIDNELDSDTKQKLKTVIVTEADYNLNRTIPTQIKSDTKAEENGWDTNILAFAANMYSEHERSNKWDEKAKAFAMNTLSMNKDLKDETIIDGKQVKDWVIGPNLYDDYSLENHDIFHPVYQMNPILELGDSALYYKMKGNEVPKAFEHNIKDMYNKVLKKIVLATGEWAYPNGCDWSVDLLDHINSISYMSTYFKDVDSKMIEMKLIQFIRARQLEYKNGSFVGPNSDIGPRRESVQAERLVYTYLFHKYFGYNSDQTTTWDKFVSENSGSAMYSDGDVILNKNKDRFSSFAWDNKNMGLIIPDSNKYLTNGFVNFPYQKSMTGSINVQNKSQNQFHISHNNRVYDNKFTTTGLLNENDSTIDHYISYTSLPGNVVLYMDEVKAKADISVTKEEGIPVGLQSDNISGENRLLESENSTIKADGTNLTAISGTYVNVDESLSMIVNGGSGIKYGNKELSNSVYFSKLYGSYNDTTRNFLKNDIISSKSAVFYSNIKTQKTKELSQNIIYPLTEKGWKSVVVNDIDGKQYLVLSNFYGESTNIKLNLPKGAPILSKETEIIGNTSTTNFIFDKLDTQIIGINAFIDSIDANLKAFQPLNNSKIFYIKNIGKRSNINITFNNNGNFISKKKAIKEGKSYVVELKGKEILLKEDEYPKEIVVSDILIEPSENKISLSWKSTLTKGIKDKILDKFKRIFVNVKEKDIKEGYIIERRNFNGNWSKIATLPWYNTTFDDLNIVSSTTYQYRITAFDEEKNTITMTKNISTLPKDDKYGLVNISKGKPIYSTYQQSNYMPINMSDGDLNSFWVSENSFPKLENPVIVNVDLTRSEDINRIRIVPRKNYGPKNIEILTSIDNVNFTSVLSTNLPNSTFEFILPVLKAQFIRLKINSSYDTVIPERNVQIAEFEVFRASSDIVSPVLTSNTGSFKNNNLKWEDKSNNEDGFIIERSYENGIYEKIGVVGKNTTEFYDTKVVPGKEYNYIVSAFNVKGRSYSNISTVKTISISTGKLLNTDIKAIASSSQSNYPIEKAFDDNNSTFYVSQEIPSSTQSINIDINLKDTILLDKLTFQPRINGSYYYNPKDFSILVSINGVDYTKIKDVNLPLSSELQTVSIGLVETKFIRLVISSVNNPGATKNLQCAEIGVYSGVKYFSEIGINLEKSNINKDEVTKLTLNTAKMNDGTNVELANVKLNYIIEDSSIATIDETGIIKGIEKGTTNVIVFAKVEDVVIANKIDIKVE